MRVVRYAFFIQLRGLCVPAPQKRIVNNEQAKGDHHPVHEGGHAAFPFRDGPGLSSAICMLMHVLTHRVLQVRIRVTLPPCFLGNVRCGVEQSLNNYLMRWVDYWTTDRPNGA
jgi:hypothetical protein